MTETASLAGPAPGRAADRTDNPPALATLAMIARVRALTLIVVAGLVIRLVLLLSPRSYFPDQVFQYFEPAYRLVFGRGIVTWEYRYGIRSWLLPLALSAPMRLGAWLAPHTGAYLVLAKLALVLLSLASIVAAAAIGERTSRLHAVFAAFVVAIWSEFALFATQALTESIALTFFIAAAALVYGRSKDAWRFVAVGALLALAAVVRVQYAPAIALFGAIAAGRDARRWTMLGAGAVAILVASGSVDLLMGQRPMAWILANLRENITHGRATSYSDDGPLFYPYVLFAAWGAWVVPIVLFAALGARRYPALMACALANIAVHSLIAHKEYRFILLSSGLFVLLAAIGTADVIALAASRDRGSPARFVTLAVLAWCGASISVATVAFSAQRWAKGKPGLDAFAYLHDAEKVCGVAITGIDWAYSGGYSYLDRASPVYMTDSAEPVPAWISHHGASFDTVVGTPGDSAVMPAPFRRDRCFGDDGRFPEFAVCLYRRPGPCDPAVARDFEINTVLARIDR